MNNIKNQGSYESLFNKLPHFYSSGFLNFLGNNIYVVKHLNKNQRTNQREPFIFKAPGGTYMGPRKNWEERGEGQAFYDISNRQSIRKKLYLTMNYVFGTNVVQKNSSYIDETINHILLFIKNPEKIHLVVEYIEEVGIIPTDFEEFYHIPNKAHNKYFFKITKAVTYSSSEKKFIDLHSTSQIPQVGKDFICADGDIKDFCTLDINVLMQQRNISWSLKEALSSYMKFKEKIIAGPKIITPSPDLARIIEQNTRALGS